MARAISSIFSLNRGVVDRRGLARVDVKRLAMAAPVPSEAPTPTMRTLPRGGSGVSDAMIVELNGVYWPKG